MLLTTPELSMQSAAISVFLLFDIISHLTWSSLTLLIKVPPISPAHWIIIDQEPRDTHDVSLIDTIDDMYVESSWAEPCLKREKTIVS